MPLIDRIRLKNTILTTFVTLSTIFIPAFIFHKYIESLLFFIGHWVIQEQFPKQYRFSTYSMCQLITGIVFFFGVSFILPLSCSLFFTIPLNYFISWISYTKKQANYYELECLQLRDRLSKAFPSLQPIDIKNCTEEQLVERCKLLKMTKYATEMAINVFVKKMTVEQLSALYCINKRSVVIHKARLKKRLQL